VKAIAFVLITFFTLAGSAFPQGGPPPIGEFGSGTRKVIIRREMGNWWKDSDVVKKLQLSDNQVSQLDRIFYEHRLKLIDYEADTQKQDLKLQTMLDQDRPEEAQIGAQVDQVLAARGKLEREFTFMNLDLRKVLTVEQWKQLRAIREERGPKGANFFFRTMPGGPGALPDGPMGGAVSIGPPPPPDVF
jgi:Spy/CpxP family protein refolding chaperone